MICAARIDLRSRMERLQTCIPREMQVCLASMQRPATSAQAR